MLMSLVVTFVVLLITGGMARCSQRHFNRWGDAFRCRPRLSGYTSAIWPSMGRHWSRPMWALWNEDVLVVRRGPIRARIIPLRGHVTGGVRALSSHELRRCGPQPVSVVRRIWDGSYMEVAAADEAGCRSSERTSPRRSTTFRRHRSPTADMTATQT